MTLETLPLPRRRTVSPFAAVMFTISVGLISLAAWLWATGDDRVLIIDFAPAATSTTLVPIESVGLIAPACATVDAAFYPCASQMIGVQS
jgi:hypothetical protein